jgi:hypothetical protein
MNQADQTEFAKTQKRLRQVTNELHQMVPNVASARQVIEFSSERRKTLLAIFTAPLLAGSSAAAAEVMARANPKYIKELTTLEGQSKEAYGVVAKWDAMNKTWDAARSLMSFHKANREG